MSHSVMLVAACGLAIMLAGCRRGGDSEESNKRVEPLTSASTPQDGKAFYTRNCAVCHGEAGKGDGPAAEFLLPKPRDFTEGRYRVRSTAAGEMPTDEDLLRSITNGLPGRNSYFKGMKATVSEKGQVTIPKHLRDRLGLRPGHVLDFREERGRLVATKVAPQDPLESVYRVLKLGRPTDGLIASLRDAEDAV